MSHWAKGDVFGAIRAALFSQQKSLHALTIEDLAPLDHFHARGFAATVELADRLKVAPGSSHLLDIGCGLGGPARYFAKRFQCRVTGLDITEEFVNTGNMLTSLLRMEDRVRLDLGDGQRLPYPDAAFDGACALHVTMNIADREGFFSQAHRVLKPGAFLAITEHGRGTGGPLHYPVPWSEDGVDHLRTPEETRALLRNAGFADIEVEPTGARYLKGYKAMISMIEQGKLPPLGTHLLLGPTYEQKVRNSARNIEEERTAPVRIICRKP